MRKFVLAAFFFLSVSLLVNPNSPFVYAKAPLPLEALQEEGVYVEINKKNNLLTVFVNGRSTYRFQVATGRSNGLTPEGEFHIVTKIVKPWYVRKQIPGGHKDNPLGTRWLGISVPGTGGYSYGIHGTNRPYSIGRHASSGCVRMHNKDIEWLYRHIPLGTKVIIK
ncbi:L,D-transpeptidase [Paenibacillus agricola]|uniref:L,D-transpeptidase n=1 Tax=Paenibacillus agricola TaxID=2716264 RepID=A0ABX0J843_9BACL|nr:L,D-transpeptidase [Paenibacillus agricola]NHN31003.1 L,D-transpeptidase [Paenibacillus agricola]